MTNTETTIMAYHSASEAGSTHRGWLRYFVAALGVGLAQAQGTELLDYWWVYSDELPEVDCVVERGSGEDLYWCVEPAEMDACEKREQMLQAEAAELARIHMKAGEPTLRAYEEAWSEVYRRHWLRDEWRKGWSRLDNLIIRLLEGETVQLMSDAHIRFALSMLLPGEQGISLQEGRSLLSRIVQNLRAHGMGTDGQGIGANDELMKRFAEALKENTDSRAAFREVLFAGARDRIVHHRLYGYVAPWSSGIYAAARYRQAPVKHHQTVASGNSSAEQEPLAPAPEMQQPVTLAPLPESKPVAPGLNDLPAAESDFLATAPEQLEEEADKKEKKEEELTVEENEETVVPVGENSPWYGYRPFSLRRAAAAAVAEPAPTLTWAGSSGSVWQVNGADSSSPWTGGTFQNGYNVLFNGNGVREVTISGVVAPGQITISPSDYASTLGGGIVQSDSFWKDLLGGSAVNAQMKYGYAFVGTDTSCIADASPHTPTGIEINGGTVVVLNTANTFSGGVKVTNGALYLGCNHAAGTGDITLYNDASWTRYFNTGEGSSFNSATWSGTELMVNYKAEGASYVAAHVDNHIVLAGKQDGSGRVSISFGTANYEETAMPSAAGRMLSLTGGIEGKGDLYLYGYSTAAASAENEVSNFAINRTNYSGSGSYSGTVHLMNSFNNSQSTERAWMQGYLTGGAVQLTLQDDVFADAVVNMTREVGNNDVGWSKFVFWSASDGGTGKSMTSDNILALSGDVALKGLESSFTNAVWRHKANTYYVLWVIPITLYDTIRSSCSQTDERWRVRVVTDSMSTLTLDDDSSATHRYDGAVGFAQSYVQVGQHRINEYDASSTDASFTAGSGSLGVESSLDLIKRGAATQYIHSARLNTLSLQQGTIGFNHLDVNGYLNLTSGTTLQLGVTKDSVSSTGWEKITSGNYQTNSGISIKSGKELLVIAADDGGKSINVTGSITMNSGSDIIFSVLRPEPGTSADKALLKLTGSLTLQSDIPINVNFSSVEFAKESAGKTYYLVSAGTGITINGKDASSFQTRYIPLGNGYYGMLNMQNSSSVDYLVMTVSGDPRRTWSGNIGANATSKGVWTAASVDAIDYTWKENHNFMNGEVVLFGNLYQPTAWKDGEWGASSTNTTVVGDTQHSGTPGTVTIDGVELSGFQQVEIKGEVAPVSVAINADFLLHDVELKDNTNYYFYGSGSIRDAKNSEIKLPDFTSNNGEEWKTYLRKGGTGTAVIATANTFSGGSVLEGGRLVMQHKSALGTGGITIQNGAVLQGDFADNRSTGSWSSAYTGEGMTTTTIANPVYAAIFISDDGTISSTEVDGYIAGAHDKKLVLSELSGGADTVLTLSGNSSDSAKTDRYTYSVFKVLNPDEFYGTVKMDGNLHGSTDAKAKGGKVQMEIMTTEKATGGGNWLNTKVDLSVANGTERTVLALDALGTANASASQVAQIAALQGTSADGSRINSSVLSMSTSKAITLEIIGSRNSDYDGVLGFGDFQKTVDYNSTQTDIGTVKHHYGRSEKGLGTLSVHKLGGSVQSVNSAWLDSLEVGNKAANTAGGRFIVDFALVVGDIQSADTSRIAVGRGVESSMYSLSVGAGGVLAMDTDSSVDAFAGIGAGIPATVELVPDTSSSQQGSLKEEGVAPSAFILFENGATISAFGDWKTTQRTGTASPKQGITVNYTVTTDIATGATVTFNTHNYTPDEYITASNDVFGRYNSSHAIQLLGEMKGSNVNLIFNNELISAAAVKAGTATKRADGLGYEGETGTQMGYVAIRDIHQFTGDITVEGMTTLQVTNTNSSAASGTGNIDITVQGANAALQFTDTVTDQYINNLVLKDGGQLLLGGTLKTTTDSSIIKVDETQAELKIQTRTAEQASLDNLDLVKTSSSKTISLGGTDANRTDVENAQITTVDTAENYDKGRCTMPICTTVWCSCTRRVRWT